MGSTACPGNYQCGYALDDMNISSAICTLSDAFGNVIEEMPRYNIISVPSKAIGDFYGFPISAEQSDEGPVIAYYSNLGPILTSEQREMDSKIKVAIIVIHGSGRNADEYLYSIMTAAQMQHSYPPDQVLVLAPRFLAVEDGVFAVPVVGNEMMEMRAPMKWNETDPIPHTWRYGANALSPSDAFSSYDVIDAIVEHLVSHAGEGGRFEDLKSIVVAGHSAGGQFTHRWSLTSNSAAWGDAFSARRGTSIKSRNLRVGNDTGRLYPAIVVIVANPRSFAYLDARRWMNATHYETPSQDLRDNCPTYNRWE